MGKTNCEKTYPKEFLMLCDDLSVKKWI